MALTVSTYSDWLAGTLSQYEQLAKTLVAHKAEKGRVVEGIVKSAIRAILPGKFSIGTGFVVTSSGQVSTQLDLVIYDGFSNAPVLLEGGTGLFPVEIVYGVVEVKSLLAKKDVQSAAAAIGTLRRLALEKRYVRFGAEDRGSGQQVVKTEQYEMPLAPRTFIFSVRSNLSDVKIQDVLREATEAENAYVHGLAVAQKNLFFQQIPFRRPHAFEMYHDKAFARFCASLLASIQSMPMAPVYLGGYFDIESTNP